MIHGGRRPSIILAMCAVAALAGCGSTDDPPSGVRDPDGSSTSAYSGPVPSCDGPWAAEVGDAYRSTNDRLAHEALDDCQVSEAEYSALGDAYVSCMAAKGFSLQIIGPGEEVSVKIRPGAKTDSSGLDPEETAAMSTCGSGFDAAAGLRGRMLRNPENLNEDDIVVACLIKAGVVDKGYTVKDFQREREEEKYSYDKESFTVFECGRDPLGSVPAHG